MLKRIRKRMPALIVSAFLACLLFPGSVRAEGGVLTDSNWQYLFTADSVNGGLIQSICLTNDYLITIENVADGAETLDIVSAYYRNDTDAYGNPVERFSLANRVQAEEWEHGNGMAYNPNTNEIYVSLYTNTIPENRGCIYVMDPDTLTRKGTIKITDDFNILAIDYDQANDRYFIQTNADYAFSIMVLDSQFQIIEDFGAEPADPGYNFQDFCLAGDYLLEFPLTWGMNIGEFMMAYSVSERAVVDTIQLFFGELPDEQYIEPESLARLDDTGFIIAVNATNYDNYRRCLFYRVEFPNLPLPSATVQEPEYQGELSVQMYEGYEGRAVERAEEELPETVVTSVSVTKGNKTLTNTKPEKKKSAVPKILIAVLIFLLAAGTAFFMYVQYVRRVRAKKEARMRRARRIMLAKIAQEGDEDEEEDDGLEEWV